MKKVCLLALAAWLVATLPLAAWLYLPATKLVYAQNTVSITISSDTISFGPISPPVTRQGATGQGSGSPAITITIESGTDVAVNVGIMGSNTNGLDLDKWEYGKSFESDYTQLTSSYVEVYSNQGPPNGSPIELDFYHYVTVPAGTSPDTYSVNISYKAINASSSF